jgi:Trk-type K+ transport system membrane component
VSTRTAGVSVVNLQLLHAPLLVSYLVMMYISVYPVAISVRRTNVYEEQSLGVFVAEDEEDASFLGRQGRHIKR